jgi:hypothetical protein
VIANNDLFEFESNIPWHIKKLFELLPGKREISGNAAEWLADNPADFESEHPDYKHQRYTSNPRICINVNCVLITQHTLSRYAF